MTRRWREAFGVGDHRRLTCLSYGLELPSAEAYERARHVAAERDESFLGTYQYAWLDEHGRHHEDVFAMVAR
jgi:hypothetical protein